MMFECTFLPQSVFGRLERSRPVIIQPKQNTNNNKKTITPTNKPSLSLFCCEIHFEISEKHLQPRTKKKSLLIAYRRKFCTSFHFRRILWLLEHKSNGCDCWFCSLHSPKNHYTAVCIRMFVCVCAFFRVLFGNFE